MGRANPFDTGTHLDPARPIAVLAVVAFCSVFWLAVVAAVATVTARALHLH